MLDADEIDCFKRINFNENLLKKDFEHSYLMRSKV